MEEDITAVNDEDLQTSNNRQSSHLRFNLRSNLLGSNLLRSNLLRSNLRSYSPRLSVTTSLTTQPPLPIQPILNLRRISPPFIFRPLSHRFEPPAPPHGDLPPTPLDLGSIFMVGLLCGCFLRDVIATPHDDAILPPRPLDIPSAHQTSGSHVVDIEENAQVSPTSSPPRPLLSPTSSPHPPLLSPNSSAHPLLLPPSSSAHPPLLPSVQPSRWDVFVRETNIVYSWMVPALSSLVATSVSPLGRFQVTTLFLHNFFYLGRTWFRTARFRYSYEVIATLLGLSAIIGTTYAMDTGVHVSVILAFTFFGILTGGLKIWEGRSSILTGR